MSATWQEEWLASLNTVWVAEKRKPKRKPLEGWLRQYGDGGCSKSLVSDSFRLLFDSCKGASNEDCFRAVHMVEATEAKEIWRLLEPGEVRQEGDYVWSGGGWFKTIQPGDRVDSAIVRRRVKVIEVVE